MDWDSGDRQVVAVVLTSALLMYGWVVLVSWSLYGLLRSLWVATKVVSLGLVCVVLFMLAFWLIFPVVYALLP